MVSLVSWARLDECLGLCSSTRSGDSLYWTYSSYISSFLGALIYGTMLGFFWCNLSALAIIFSHFSLSTLIPWVFDRSSLGTYSGLGFSFFFISPNVLKIMLSLNVIPHVIELSLDIKQLSDGSISVIVSSNDTGLPSHLSINFIHTLSRSKLSPHESKIFYAQYLPRSVVVALFLITFGTFSSL